MVILDSTVVSLPPMLISEKVTSLQYTIKDCAIRQQCNRRPTIKSLTQLLISHSDSAFRHTAQASILISTVRMWYHMAYIVLKVDKAE